MVESGSVKDESFIASRELSQHCCDEIARMQRRPADTRSAELCTHQIGIVVGKCPVELFQLTDGGGTYMRVAEFEVDSFLGCDRRASHDCERPSGVRSSEQS